MTKQERIEKQKMRLEEMKKIEKSLHEKGFEYIAGVDEVGRGPLAGPVATAAVVLPENFNVPGIDDSKKLSEKKREELFDEIIRGCIAYGIGVVDHRVIDEINILQATRLAMKRAIEECEDMLGIVTGVPPAAGDRLSNPPTADDSPAAGRQLDYVLIDAVKIEELDRPQEAIIKGDSKSLAIAAASIVAKVTRDRMMVKFAEEYPGYAFEKNKGYGTAAHYEGIRRQGTCPIHRLSFLKNMH